MKKYLALLLAVLMLAAVFAGCASKETTTDTPAASTETAEPAKTEETKVEETAAEEAPASEEGKVFNIYAWNEEFKGFFEKYYTVPEGVTVNWIITPRKAPIAVSKTDKMRIFDPETNQKARAWAMDYRKFHDIWITDKKAEQCFVNVKESLT